MVEELETETQDPIPPLPKGFKVVKSDNGGDLPPLPKGYVQKKNPVGTGGGNGTTVGSSNPQSNVSTKKTGSIDFEASSLEAGNDLSKSNVDDGKEILPAKNSLELVGEINDLSKVGTFHVSGGTGGAAAGFSQSPDAYKKSQENYIELKGSGLKDKDIAEIKNDLSDLSPEVQGLSVTDKDGKVSYPYSLKSLGELRDVDPIAYKTKLNAVKTYDVIRRTAGIEKANEFSRLQNQNQAQLNKYTDIEDFNRKKEKQKEIIRQTLKGDDRDIAMQRVDENSAIILNDAIPDSKSAEDYLNNRLYQSKGTLSKNLTLHDALMDSQDVEFNGNVNDFKLESIQSKLDPNNPADQIAFSKYKRGINLNDALNNSSNLDAAALQFASSEDDHLAATIKTLNAGGQELPNSYKGEIVANFLNDPEIIAKAQDNPEFAKEYTKTAQNLYFNYPDYAKKEIGNLISQEREDKGQNNWFANVPTKESTDKLVDEMVANGKMTELQKNIYLKDIAPELGVGKSIGRGFGHILAPAFTDNSPIATPDLLTHAGEGWDNTMGGVYKSLKTLNATVNPTLPKSNGEIATDLLTALKNEHETVSVQPKGLLHKAAAASGDFIPLVVSMATGGGLLKGAGKAGEAINMALQFAGNNAEKALVAFPDSPLKQKMYTGAATSIDMFLGRLLPHNKALSQEVSNSIRKDITGVISDFASEKIKADAAKKTILNRIEDLVTKKAPEILKANTETGAIMAAFSAGHNGLDIAFGAKPPQSVEDFAKETAQAFETGFLGNTLVAAAMAGKNTATVKDNLLKASANPEHYIEQIKIAAAKNPEIAKQQEELINNVNVAVEARKVADAKGMNEKQTEDFILLHVAQNIQENTAKNATVDLVKEEATKQAKDLKARKEKVYGGEVDTKLSVPIDNVDEQGVPIGDNVPKPTEIKGEPEKITEPIELSVEQPTVSETEGKSDVVVEPTQEQQLKDIKDGNLVTFTYKSEGEVPEIFKDKISSRGETNGEPIIRVTIPKSLADYHLANKGKKPDGVVDEGVVDNGLSEGANKILGLHDNGVNYDLFDNNKLREIAKENGIDLPEGAKNADIIEALKNKRNEATAKGLENLSEKDFDKLTPSQKVALYKEHGITKDDGSPITEKDIESNPLQYSYDFMASSDSGKWNSANSELESAVQGNRKQYSLYKLMNGEFDTFKEFVDFINSKNYGDKIEYTERMKRADDMSPAERKSAVDSYNKSVEDKAGDKSQKEKDILDEHGLKDETEYSPHELVEKFPLKGVQKVIWDIISPIVKKLGIKVKFSSSRITEGFDGSSNPMNGEVLLRPSTLKNGRLGEVLVHEVVHSLTTKIISRVNSGVETGLTSKQVAAVKGLGKLYKSIEADNNLQNKYPVKDIFEFIAHLTNDTFVKELQSKDRNFIQKVVDFISDILGLSDANELAKKYLKDIIHDGTFLEKEGITVVSSDYAANVKGAEGLTPKQRLLEAIKNNSKTTAEKYHDLKSKGKENDFTKAVEQSLKAEDKAPVTKPEGKSDVVVDEGVGDKPLTKEAEDLIASVGEGSMPTFITKNLEKIAADNGIEITGKMTASDVVNALKEKQQSLSTKPEIKNEEAQVTQDTNQKEKESITDKGTTEAGKEAGGGKEGKLNDLSGIKKGLVSDKIIEGVDLERVSDKDMMDMGRKILDTGEVKPEALVTKIITDGKGVLTPTEVVGLITYKRDIDNAVQDVYKQINDRVAKGEDIGTLGVEAKNLERQINDFDVMAVITAQQQSMAFRLRQRMLDKEYNVVTQIEKYKANNGGEIPADVEARFREVDKELKEVKAKLVEAEKKAAQKEGQDAVDNIKESVGREKKYTEEELQAELKKERASLRVEKKEKVHKAIDDMMDKWAKKISPEHLRGTDTKGVSADKVFKSVGAIMKKAYDAGEVTAKIVEDAVKYVSEKLGRKDWGIEEFKNENWDEKLRAASEKKAKDKPTINEDGTVSIPNQMLRDLVKRGVTDIDGLTKEVHDQVKKDLPNITERQVRDYITDYGKKVNPTADVLQTQVNTAKRVGRLLSELEDLKTMGKIEFLAKYRKPKPSESKITEREQELRRQIKALGSDIVGDIKGSKESDTKHQSRIEYLEKELNRVRERRRKDPKEKKESTREIPEDERLLLEQIEAEQTKWDSEKDAARQRDNDYGKLETERNRQLRRVEEINEKIDILKSGKLPETKSVEAKKDTPEIEALKAEKDALEKSVRQSIAHEKKMTDLETELQRLKDRKEKEPKPDSKRVIGTEERLKRDEIEAERKAWAVEKNIDKLKTDLQRVRDRQKKVTNPKDRRELTDTEKDLVKQIKAEQEVWNKEVEPERKVREALKAADKSLTEYERRIAEKDFSKKDTNTTPETPELKALRDKRDAKRKEYEKLKKSTLPKIEKTEAERLKAAKESAKRKIDELTTKIKNKDFAKPVKKLPVTDTEIQNLNHQKELLQEQYDKEQYKLELKNRKWWQKGEDIALEVFTGISRTLVAGVDLSAGLVQGTRLWFTNPKMSARATVEMFKQFASEKRNAEWFAKLKSSGVYEKIKQSKLAVTDEHGRASVKEGMFIVGWANKIYDGIAYVVTGGYKPATKFVRQINPIKASQRAFDGYVNYVRVEKYLELVKIAEKDGHTFEADPKMFEKLADHVNTITGRGSMGALETSSKWLSVAMFAPRKVISEIKVFTPYAFAYYAKMPKYVRQKALLNFATFIASFVSVNASIWAANQMYQGKKLDEDEDHFWDMTSSNFMTHNFGKTRVGVGGGAKSSLVFMARLFTGRFTDQYGKTTKLGERYGKQVDTRFDLGVNYLKGKASPGMGASIKYLDQKKGLEIDNTEMAKDLTIPMWMQDSKELYKDHPVAIGTLFNILSIFGAGVRVVEDKKTGWTEDDKKNPIYKPFIDAEIEMPKTNPKSIGINNEKEGKRYKLNEFDDKKITEFEKVKSSTRDALIKKVKSRNYVYKDKFGDVSLGNSKTEKRVRIPFNTLTPEQLKSILSEASTKGTKEAKKKVFGDNSEPEKDEEQ